MATEPKATRKKTRFKSLLVRDKYTDANSIANVPFQIQGVSGQTGDLLQALDSTGAVLAKIDASGNPTFPSATLAGGSLTAGSVLETALVTAATVGLGVSRVAHFKYSFAVDGGAVGEIIPATSPTLPNKAIILGGFANVTTALLAAGGAANISIGTHAGSAVDALKAATAKATYALNAILALTPVWTAATAFKMSAAGQISITVDTNALTAGVMEVFVVYVVAGT